MTGLLFGLIVIAWVAYLVPWATSRRDGGWVGLDEESVKRFGHSMKFVRNCDEDDLIDSGAEVSTPLMRRANRYNIRRAKQIGAKRRRIGLIIATVALVVCVVLPMVTTASWSTVFLGLAIFLGWLGISRFSVTAQQHHAQALLDEIDFSDDEPTVMLDLSEFNEDSVQIELTGEIPEPMGSLFVPLPVTPTTYVSKPLLPRSVRTIDLSAPMPEQRPVTAEKPVTAQEPAAETHADDVTQIVEFPRAVGE